MFTRSTHLSGIPVSHAVPDLDRGYARTQLPHDANPLVAQDLTFIHEVQVCPTHARMRSLDEDLVVTEGFGDWSATILPSDPRKTSKVTLLPVRPILMYWR